MGSGSRARRRRRAGARSPSDGTTAPSACTRRIDEGRVWRVTLTPIGDSASNGPCSEFGVDAVMIDYATTNYLVFRFRRLADSKRAMGWVQRRPHAIALDPPSTISVGEALTFMYFSRLDTSVGRYARLSDAQARNLMGTSASFLNASSCS